MCLNDSTLDDILCTKLSFTDRMPVTRSRLDPRSTAGLRAAYADFVREMQIGRYWS